MRETIYIYIQMICIVILKIGQLFINFSQLVEKNMENRHPYLTLDIGDHIDRSNIFTEGTLGKGNVHLLNDAKYDYVTIGNNEGITLSHEELESLYIAANFEVIVSNFTDL